MTNTCKHQTDLHHLSLQLILRLFLCPETCQQPPWTVTNTCKHQTDFHHLPLQLILRFFLILRLVHSLPEQWPTHISSQQSTIIYPCSSSSDFFFHPETCSQPLWTVTNTCKHQTDPSPATAAYPEIFFVYPETCPQPHWSVANNFKTPSKSPSSLPTATAHPVIPVPSLPGQRPTRASIQQIAIICHFSSLWGLPNLNELSPPPSHPISKC